MSGEGKQHLHFVLSGNNLVEQEKLSKMVSEITGAPQSFSRHQKSLRCSFAKGPGWTPELQAVPALQLRELSRMVTEISSLRGRPMATVQSLLSTPVMLMMPVALRKRFPQTPGQ